MIACEPKSLQDMANPATAIACRIGVAVFRNLGIEPAWDRANTATANLRRGLAAPLKLLILWQIAKRDAPYSLMRNRAPREMSLSLR